MPDLCIIHFMEKNTTTCLPAVQVPKCIGIILDGNRRWAREHDLPTLEGHRKGFENFVNIARHVQSKGIEHLVVYAFSTENWSRSEEEVSYLMDLFREMLTNKVAELKKDGMRVRVVGQRDRFDENLQRMIIDAEEDTKSEDGLNVWICLSYGARAEIVAAAQSAAAGDEEITEEVLKKHMWTAKMPDPDIVIRPGGESRLSNFLLWQVAYSELFFVDTYWPAFTESDFDAILEEYEQRERRRGK